MDDAANRNALYPRTAACACGALTVSVASPPRSVHACACLECQRRSGSSFTYTAFFPDSAVSISGAFRPFRRIAASGRWNDTHFCPDCGVGVFSRAEGLPGVIGVAVGCFADQSFEKPGTLYWVTRRHHWFEPPPGFDVVETQ